MSGVRTVEVSPDEADLRLDRWFKRHFPELSHGRLEKLLRTGQVRLDGARVKSSARLTPGQMVRVPPLGAPAQDSKPRPDKPAYRPPSATDIAMLQGAVLYRDDAVIALNKPAGLAVQGGSKTARHLDGMLDALRFGAAERPRLVHRLDKDTSGVMLLARTARAATWLTGAFRASEPDKLYWALSAGVPESEAGQIDLPLAKGGPTGAQRMGAGGQDAKPARTDYRVIDRAGARIAWLELRPLTGRTHQIRAHLAAIGTPVLGDRKYGGPDARLGPVKRLHLHASAIRLNLENGKILSITAPLPQELIKSWKFFGFDPRGGLTEKG